MRSLALAAFSSLFLFTSACGDDGGDDDDDDDDVTVDAGDDDDDDDVTADAAIDAPPTPDDAGVDSGETPADAGIDAETLEDAAIDGPILSACNPVTQAGCEAGERCTQFLVGGAPVIDCIADGATPLGGACVTPVGDGSDDCVAGTYCISGECKEICSDVPDSCSNGGVCAIYGGTFEAIDGVGLCNPACDPVAQDCAGDDACYVNLGAAESVCANVPGPAEGLEQDDACYAAQNGACFLNGCDEGFGAVGYDFDTGLAICAAFCTPAPTHTGSTANPGGVSNGTTGACADAGADEHQCRYLNSTYQLPDVSDAWGFCVPTAIWGDCTTYDVANPQPELYGCVSYNFVP